MTENNFDYEKLRQQILKDSSTNEKQKEFLLKELAKKVIPPNTKVLDVRISNEIPQKVKDDIELAERTREMLRLKFTEFGLECPELTNLEQVDRVSAILKALKQKNAPNEAPSGTAPLNDAQRGINREIGYETREEMIDALREQEKFGETDEIKKNATNILNEIFRKWVNAKKNDTNLLDRVPENLLETPIEHKKRIRRKRKGE